MHRRANDAAARVVNAGPVAATTRPSEAAVFVDALERLGVDVVFGLPGVHNLPIWDALSRSSIRMVGVRHEQTAAYADDGYARATGRLGVAIVTTGPGAANTLAAFGEARASGSGVLVVATDISTRLRRPGVYRGVLHEATDQAALFAPLAKATFEVAGVDTVMARTIEAGRLAVRAPSGPVYLGIPTDVLEQLAGDPNPAAAATVEPPPTDGERRESRHHWGSNLRRPRPGPFLILTYLWNSQRQFWMFASESGMSTVPA